ncbi:MAG: T9SS type A sorting domain-containing protein, partial [Bacteroidales bacterium]|nr:T9SS type A sorting domain-containing protein [Bacteroidales bacterium]
ILVCGAYTYGETYGGLYPYDGWLIKLNPDGSTVWNKKYRFPTLDDYVEDSIYCYFKALSQLENGNIAIAFQSRRTPNGSRIDPSLLMLNEFGDTIFSKHYVFPIGNIDGAAGDLWVNSIVETPDSGIAISGYGEFKRYDEIEEQWTYDQRIFLIKTDSLGNDHFVSVSEPQAKPIARYELEVYPNPVSDYLFIETDENSHTDGELTIVNQSGQIVYQNHTTKDALSSGICVDSFSPGNYLIQLKTEDKTFFGKFVKY